MAYENILVERDPAISTITVNRPKALNALNSNTLRELTLAVRECADSRVIILTGAGDRAFVAGADIAEMAPMGPWQAREFSELEHCRSIGEKIAVKGPLAVARAKRLVERGYDMTLRAANRQEAESFALLFDTEDRREGMRAFVEKRPARFTGK